MLKQIIHISLLSVAGLTMGCTLSAPSDFGALCENIQLEDIIPACENDDISCLETYQDAVEMHHCPKNYYCNLAPDHNICTKFNCNQGYHPKTGKDGVCEPNTASACGSSDPQNSKVTDCTTAFDNALKTHCDSDGKCIIDSCEPNYHVSDNQCEKDSGELCGKNQEICAVNHGKSECISGKCVTVECDDKYHEHENICISDNISGCGDNEVDCESTIAGWYTGSCIEGQCVATDCIEGYHLYQNTCEINDTNNCQTHGNKCEDRNAISVFCDNLEGCKSSDCNKGNHLSNDGSRCNPNTDNACGNDDTDCSSQTLIKGWASMRCDVAHGKCVLNECQNGYYNFNGITCFQNCYLATHIDRDCDHGNCTTETEQYCCSSTDYRDSCKGQGHCTNPDYSNGFSGCMDVDVHLTDVYHACLDEQLGTTDQYSNISCTSETCAVTTSLDNLSLLSRTCVYQF